MRIKNNYILITCLAGCLLFPSCSSDNCIVGEGPMTTTTLSIADFTGIDLSTTTDVTINQGTSQRVEATGHPNIIELISANVSNGIWVIDLEGGCIQDFELSLDITVPNINQLRASSTGNIVVNDFSNQNVLTVDISSTGSLTLNRFEGISELDVSLSSTGDFIGNEDISTLDRVNVNVSSTGAYSAFAIRSPDYTINASSTGDSEITALNTLDVTISGTGDVSYKGMPLITQNITGTGDLIDAN